MIYHARVVNQKRQNKTKEKLAATDSMLICAFNSSPRGSDPGATTAPPL